MLHNGQEDPFNLGIPEHGKFNAGLFGCFNFDPIDKALCGYRMWLEIYEQAGDRFDSDFDHITVREDDPVAARYWQPG